MDQVTRVFTREDVMGLLLGLVAPVLISALKNKNWVMWKKMATVGTVSLILSVITIYLTTQQLDAFDVKEMAITMIATAIPAYKLLWEGGKIDQKVTEFNLVTSTKESVEQAVENITEHKKD